MKKEVIHLTSRGIFHLLCDIDRDTLDEDKENKKKTTATLAAVG